MFGLINALIENFLGKYGRILLDILLSNSFIICIIVIVYGIVLHFAQKNMENIGKKAKMLKLNVIFSGKEPNALLSAKESELWEQLRKDIKFPFISLPSSLFLYRITEVNINKLLVRYFLSQKYQKKLQKP